MWKKTWTWRRLLRQAVRRADSRALANTGMRMEISSAMMPMTTSNSTSVKACAPRTGKGGDACGSRGLIMVSILPAGHGTTYSCGEEQRERIPDGHRAVRMGLAFSVDGR